MKTAGMGEEEEEEEERKRRGRAEEEETKNRGRAEEEERRQLRNQRESSFKADVNNGGTRKCKREENKLSGFAVLQLLKKNYRQSL